MAPITNDLTNYPMIDEVNTHIMNECQQYKENFTESVKCGVVGYISIRYSWVLIWYCGVVGGRGGAYGGAGPLNISDQQG